jgi:hypothetical protein
MNARLSAQDWSRRAYPVFAGNILRENINRGGMLRMHRNGAINLTQGDQCMRCERGENEIQNKYIMCKSFIMNIINTTYIMYLRSINDII